MFLVGQPRTFLKTLKIQIMNQRLHLYIADFLPIPILVGKERILIDFLCHNGEINTIKGNADRMLSREETMVSDYLEDEMTKIMPVVNTSGSDSSMLDNTLEFLMMNGMPLPLALMICIPEPWAKMISRCHRKRKIFINIMLQ